MTANPKSSSTPAAERSEITKPVPRPSIISEPMLNSADLTLETQANGEPAAAVKSANKAPASAKITPSASPLKRAVPEPQAAAFRLSSTQGALATPPSIPLPTVDPAEPRPGGYVRLANDAEPGSQISVDGQSIGVAPFSEIFIELDTHTFVVETPQGLIVEQQVDVKVDTDVIEF